MLVVLIYSFTYLSHLTFTLILNAVSHVSHFSQNIENNWLKGDPNLQLINCRSENSKGVYCLQYDDSKIVSGLRDNTIKIWDRQTLQCTKVSQLRNPIIFSTRMGGKTLTAISLIT